ncbi:hypothetical protein [Lentzea fradiae]|uniref:hypothetical protein n=1 Tax=Lentzea fradiae TaxID=200378 RepID=UPI000B7F3ED2|nr:hypothetical protein [Lentzea fradiae]
MTEEFRKRGPWQAVAGVVLAAWVVLTAAVAETGTPQVLVATAATGAMLCLCPVAGGLVARRVTGAVPAARLRHVFVVLEGAALALLFPFYWFAFSVEPVGRPGALAVGVVVSLVVPVVVALVLALRTSLLVHRIVVAEFGPLVPDAAAPALVPRIRVLGTLLVVAGSVLSVSVVVLAFTSPSRWLLLEAFGLVVTLTPVVLGLSLTRVDDVRSARRRNIGAYIVVPTAAGYAAAELVSAGGAAGMLFGALVLAATVLLIGAILVLREFTGSWERPWRVSR